MYDYLLSDNNYLYNTLDYPRELLSEELQCNDLISKEVNKINNILLKNKQIKNIILEYADNYISFLSYRLLYILNSANENKYNLYIMGSNKKTKNLFSKKPNFVTKYKMGHYKHKITTYNTLFVFYNNPTYIVKNKYKRFNKINVKKWIIYYTDILTTITNQEIEYIALNFYNDTSYKDYLYEHQIKNKQSYKNNSNINLHYIDFNKFPHNSEDNSYSAAIKYINSLDPKQNYIFYKADDMYYTQKTNRLINYSIFTLRKNNNINIIPENKLEDLIDTFKTYNWKIHKEGLDD